MSEKTNFDSLQPYQDDFTNLAELAGIPANPKVYRILISLLGMQVSPTAIYKMLRMIRKTSRFAHSTHSGEFRTDNIGNIAEVGNT